MDILACMILTYNEIMALMPLYEINATKSLLDLIPKRKLFFLIDNLQRAGIDPHQSYVEYDEYAFSMFGKEDCVIKVYNGGLLLRQFNPFLDNKITCHFEENITISNDDIVILRELFR